MEESEGGREGDEAVEEVRRRSRGRREEEPYSRTGRSRMPLHDKLRRLNGSVSV